MSVYDLPLGIGCLRKEGRRGLRSANQLNVEAHWEVLPRTTRSEESGSGSPDTKSSNVNPSSSFGNRGFGVAVSGSDVVASERELLAVICGEVRWRS
jgi:hypothetical protein